MNNKAGIEQGGRWKWAGGLGGGQRVPRLGSQAANLLKPRPGTDQTRHRPDVDADPDPTRPDVDYNLN